jgi:hypothetical protein
MNPPKKTKPSKLKHTFAGMLNPAGPSKTSIPSKQKALQTIDYNALNTAIVNAIADLEAVGAILRQQLVDAGITSPSGIQNKKVLDEAMRHKDWQVWDNCLRGLSVKGAKLATLSSIFLNDDFELKEDIKSGVVYRSQKDLDSLFSI